MVQLSTEELVDELVNLAGDEPLASDYKSPRHLVVSLWRSHRQACSDMIVESAKFWDDMPQLFDDILMAARDLNDRDYLALLRHCSEIELTPANCGTAISSLLIEYDESTNVEFSGKFRKQVGKVVNGQLNPDRVDFGSQLREICRLRLKQLVPELEQLKSLYERNAGSKYVFDSSVKAYVDAALQWFQHGVDGIRRVASDPREPIEYRVACVYCLGCSGVENVEGIATIYRETSSGRTFDLRMACVEAVVYSAGLADADEFVDAALKTISTTKTLKGKAYNADVGLLLAAVYNLPSISSQLRNTTEMWLDAKNKDIAALALLAMERHGLQDDQRRRELGSHYRTNRELREATPSPLMLMAFRR